MRRDLKNMYITYWGDTKKCNVAFKKIKGDFTMAHKGLSHYSRTSLTLVKEQCHYLFLTTKVTHSEVVFIEKASQDQRSSNH